VSNLTSKLVSVGIYPQSYRIPHTQGFEDSTGSSNWTRNSINDTAASFTAGPADDIVASADLQTHFQNSDFLSVPLEYESLQRSRSQSLDEGTLLDTEAGMPHSVPFQGTPSGNDQYFTQGLHHQQLEYPYNLPAAGNMAVTYQDNFDYTYSEHSHLWPGWSEESPSTDYYSTPGSSSR
jgi:hypothetical protein